MFETLEGSPIGNCSMGGTNPATLNATGTHEGDWRLPCACNTLANLAQYTVDHRIKKTG
jgi:hypothetical protein